MATTNFVHGTLIESTWLNDADAHVYDQVPAAHTAANIAVVDAGGKFVATDVEGVLQEIVAGVGGLQYFTEARSIAAPNATIPVHSLTSVGTETNIDVVLAPKGGGSLSTAIADNSAGGNKRGFRALDLQLYRLTADQVASGASSAIVGGILSKATGNYSYVFGGYAATVSGQYGVAIGGYSNIVTGTSCIALAGDAHAVGGANNASCGWQNTTTGSTNFIMGNKAHDHGISGRLIHGSNAAVAGTFQSAVQVLSKTTTDATPTVLTVQGAAASFASLSSLVVTQSVTVVAYITARSSVGDSAAWKIEGLIKQGATPATTAIVGTPTVTAIAADAGAAGWGVTLTADTTNGSAVITVTGAAATIIGWTAKVDTIEVIA